MKENSKFSKQMNVVYKSIFNQPKTMLMIAFETGILRANICRYVAKWQKQGRIKRIGAGICPISKHRAGFYTTNPELFHIVDFSNTMRP